MWLPYDEEKILIGLRSKLLKDRFLSHHLYFETNIQIPHLATAAIFPLTAIMSISVYYLSACPRLIALLGLLSKERKVSTRKVSIPFFIIIATHPQILCKSYVYSIFRGYNLPGAPSMTHQNIFFSLFFTKS